MNNVINIASNMIADSTMISAIAIVIGIAAFITVVKIAFPRKTQVWK